MSYHRLTMQSDGDSISWHLLCGFEPDDMNRPCWPHSEAGSPYFRDAGIEEGCVLDGWIESGSDGLIATPFEVDFSASFEWINSEYPVFVLSNPQAHIVEAGQ